MDFIFVNVYNFHLWQVTLQKVNLMIFTFIKHMGAVALRD